MDTRNVISAQHPKGTFRKSCRLTNRRRSNAVILQLCLKMQQNKVKRENTPSRQWLEISAAKERILILKRVQLMVNIASASDYKPGFSPRNHKKPPTPTQQGLPENRDYQRIGWGNYLPLHRPRTILETASPRDIIAQAHIASRNSPLHCASAELIKRPALPTYTGAPHTRCTERIQLITANICRLICSVRVDPLNYTTLAKTAQTTKRKMIGYFGSTFF
ncbi:uncharacterized protein LOC130281685 [Hyla sarda]|uniref:uncharacterized protein LOC130281685 n=1 Tax=Hyla sarda TaxID=327740 RepID=UPI0024C3DF12|nr:uncharacterized protein LOC130281685 [Hyla sarda]